MNEQMLQDLLSVYRYSRPMPELPARVTRKRWALMAAAAAVVLAVLLPFGIRNRATWQITEGSIRHSLQAGEAIVTGLSAVRLESRAVGIVDLAPGSMLRFEGGNHLHLDRGTMHARTFSPPGVFVVDTPRARAIDLGCEYILAVSPEGSGVLRVSAGWVELTRGSRQTLVPRKAKAFFGADGKLSPPIFEDAPPAFQNAVTRGDLSTTLALARRRDALTLLNLFRDATADERLRIYDRLNQLVPAPPGVSRDAVRQWRSGATDAWWPAVIQACKLPPIEKKKGMLRGL